MVSKISDLKRIRINDTWELIRKIGSGSFGDIYLGVNVLNGEEVAVKMEKVSATHPQLYFESRVYKCLSRSSTGVPNILYFGNDCTAKHFALVMELLGPSLEDLFNFCDRQFSLKTVLLLADQMIRRVSVVHKCNFIHRDIKPDNFLMGVGRNCNVVFLVDYGLAKKYADRGSNRHMPYRDKKTLTGTARYASINAHAGIEVSRRDDMESLAYVWIYFLKGQLPWQGTKVSLLNSFIPFIDLELLRCGNTKHQKYEQIYEKKVSTTLPVLCQGLPKEIEDYLTYCRSLRFEQCPSYEYWLRKFTDLFKRQAFKEDWVFDWTLRRNNGESQTGSKSKQKAIEAVPPKPRVTVPADNPQAVGTRNGGLFRHANTGRA
ncbi:serine/threonine protein kinase [Cichlidogyrus casuarinus]|uniref:non-specific serine/threonine protein kinase n=1 Tax=Cichlidogyrus casuarinus TaxID=1844966 RepID=A0ABD2QJW0_9PLAT